MQSRQLLFHRVETDQHGALIAGAQGLEWQGRERPERVIRGVEHRGYLIVRTHVRDDSPEVRHRYIGGMARKLATADVVPLPELLDFIRPRHRMVLTTFRAGESLHSSPVTGGVDADGRIVVATYPQRAKAANIRRRPRASLVVLSDEFDGPYVQVDGFAEVLDLPEAVEPLVEYFRSVAGEHPNWDEYRQAMVDQKKCLIRVTPQRWGPVATGGFPPR